MADAYKVKADTSIPRAIRQIDETIDGKPVYETEGRAYRVGDYVLAEDITPPLREQAESGGLDHLLEEVSLDEAQQALSVVEVGTFVPQHEAEEVILKNYGHRVVPKDQLLELRSAGADAAQSAFEQAYEDDADARPALTEPERPSLVEVSNDKDGGTDNVPSESEHVDEEIIAGGEGASMAGVEQPPGIPIGPNLAAARGEEVDQEAAKATRQRPQQRARAQQEAVTAAREKQQEQQSESSSRRGRGGAGGGSQES